MKDYLSPTEVAEMLMVSPVTLRTWAQKGLIPASNTAGGHRRYLLADVRAYAKEKGIALKGGFEDSPRILIVDDEESFANIFASFIRLKIVDADVDIATSGFHAGEKIHEYKPSIVLLDLNMPEMDGYKVCTWIKSNPKTNGIKVIAMTGDHSEESQRRILECGAEFCISKPVDTEYLVELIKQLKEEGLN